MFTFTPHKKPVRYYYYYYYYHSHFIEAGAEAQFIYPASEPDVHTHVT